MYQRKSAMLRVEKTETTKYVGVTSSKYIVMLLTFLVMTNKVIYRLF